MNIGIEAKFAGSYDEALAKVTESLKSEGFGVLTEIDIKATLKAKIDVDFRRYKILGACNPPFAHRALSTNLDVGLMLPCNVIVYEKDDGGVVIRAIDPMQTVAGADPALAEVARAVQGKLQRAMEKVSEG